MKTCDICGGRLKSGRKMYCSNTCRGKGITKKALAKGPEGTLWCSFGKHYEKKENFHKNKTTGTGLSHSCKECRLNYQSQDWVKAKRKAYYQAHKEEIYLYNKARLIRKAS